MSTGCGRCRHERIAHLHYRAGTDCALCGCPAYTRFARPWPSFRPQVSGPPSLTLVAVDGVVLV